jgi:hypothetical protein
MTPPPPKRTHTPLSPPGLADSDPKVFAGKKRYSWGCMQGRFKKPTK